MNTKQKGEISELAVSLKLLTLGKSVSKPVGDNQRYDLIIDDDGKLLRVQVKTARIKNGCLIATTARTTGKKGGVYVKSAYSSDEIDAFAIYAPELDKCYLVPVKPGVAAMEIRMRLTPSQNGQLNRVRWAKDYEL